MLSVLGRRQPRRWFVASTALLLSLAPAPVHAQQTLTVFAAASLGDAYRALGAQFESSHPGTKVQFNFAGSQQLVLQLSQGAKADLFASADERWMQAAVDSGLVAGAPAVFAQNSLVVIAPRSNPAGLAGLKDLARAGVKVVLAADAVPVGRYSRQVLKKLSATTGFGSGYGALVLANVVSYEDNVKGIVAKVQLGEADAGIVYRSDATGPVAAQLRVLDIPPAANVIATYPVTVLKQSGSAELARAFMALVLSPGGQEVLARFGFEPASQPAAAAPR